MQFEVKKIPDLPVVLGQWFEGFKFVEHGAQYAKEANAMLDKQEAPVFYVIDLTQLKTISVEGVVEVANSGAKNLKSSHRHPMNRETIIISQEKIVKLAVKGASTAAFGNLRVQLFENLDEALDYAKKNA